MAERFKALVLKTSVRVTVPGVRIPLRPHEGVSVSDRNAFFVVSAKSTVGASIRADPIFASAPRLRTSRWTSR